ncbi:MAG: AAA family ATPase [Bifidobacteriaceae bacterium]|jgi:chromosome partitioning protein|nr:AAA family ATPase [Bifidobacteriaceae bacterium]
MDNNLDTENLKNEGVYNYYMDLKIPAPKSTRIIAVANQKGGVGKTTTVVNFAAVYALKGFHVLVIDFDPQCNATTAFNIEKTPETATIYDVIKGNVDPESAIQTDQYLPTLDIIPSSPLLANADVELLNTIGREYILKEKIEAITEYRDSRGEPAYDYIIIDCGPTLGLLVVNSLVAANEVLIPIQAQYYALEGVTHIAQTISQIQKNLNPDLSLSGILITMYQGGTNLSRDVVDQVKQVYPEILIKTLIPQNVRIAEAPSHNLSVMQFAGKSTGALTYLEAALRYVYMAPNGNIKKL